MCHPWLAAGTCGFVAVLLVRELGPLVRRHRLATSDSDTGLLGTPLRDWFRRRLRPLATLLVAGGLDASAVTLLQLVTSVVSGFGYAYGWMFTGGWMLIAAGTLDVLDGEMARRQGRAGPRGAFLDSVVDRYAESVVFAGLVAFYRDVWVLWGVLAAWAGAFLVSYTRARAESLGVECREGMLQRPERYVILGGASMASAVSANLWCGGTEHQGLLPTGICVLAVLAHTTALQRAGRTLRRLG